MQYVHTNSMEANLIWIYSDQSGDTLEILWYHTAVPRPIFLFVFVSTCSWGGVAHTLKRYFNVEADCV